jgi:hypothetical protein
MPGSSTRCLEVRNPDWPIQIPEFPGSAGESSQIRQVSRAIFGFGQDFGGAFYRHLVDLARHVLI